MNPNDKKSQQRTTFSPNKTPKTKISIGDQVENLTQNQEDYFENNSNPEIQTNQEDFNTPQIDETKILQDQVVELKNNLIRKEADIQNLIKQHYFDIENAKKSTKKSVANQVLHVVNTLSLAFGHIPKVQNPEFDKFIQTLISSFDKSISDLKLVGIEIIIPKIGDEIDLNYMSLLNTPQNQSDLTVKQIVSVGLKIEGQIIQPASVLA
jgi:molecular chaperone GrpE (heat shock protein)